MPQAIVPDNLKSAVIKPGRDAVIQRSFADMPAHYDALVIPTRPRRPQDKGKVEAGVKLTQDRILAPLKGRNFRSIAEVNAAIAELLEQVNRQPMRQGPSRREQFDTYERGALRPLPATPYAYAEWDAVASVAKDYHVPVNGHFYSVPHTLVGKRLDIRITADWVTFFDERTEVASHPRNDDTRKSTARLSHMPDNHRLQAERSPDMLRAWAADVGPNIIKFVTEQLDQEQSLRGLKPCETLRDLADEYGTVEVDQAVADAFQRGVVNVTAVRGSCPRGRRRQVSHSHLAGPIRSAASGAAVMLREVSTQLTRLKLPGMAIGLERWLEDPGNADRSALECVEAMLTTQAQLRSTTRVDRFLTEAGLPPHLTLGSFDRGRVRGLSQGRLASLKTLAWVDTQQNLVITGGAGVGKRHLACELAIEAVRTGRSARYIRIGDLLDQIDAGRRAGTLDLLLKRCAKPAVLVLDGLADEPMLAQHTHWVRRLAERRTGAGSTVVVSRCAPGRWGQRMDGVADAAGIHGRLIYRAQQVRLTRAPG